MGKRLHQVLQPYAANQRKTFKSALCHLLQTEFPGVFGPAVTALFADRIDELYERFHPPASRFKVGQVLWVGVAADDFPGRQKRIENTRLVPIILDLITAQDIDDTATPKLRGQTRRNKVLRLCRQAYEQKAVLSEADLSLLLHISIGTISSIILTHERETKETIPRRGTIHDLGRSITHKAIICYKRLVRNKTTSEVAQETCHSDDEVEYYVHAFRQVQLCHDSGMSKDDTARATGYSLSLVQEYLDLIEQFRLPSVVSPPGKDGVQSQCD